MENTNYLSIELGNLRKGKPTLKFKKTLSRNLVYCYNLYNDKNKLFEFYSKTFYGVYKNQGIVRQLSSNLVDIDDVLILIDFNTIFKEMFNFENKTNNKISLKETIIILNKYLDKNLNNLINNYYKNK